MKSRGGVKKPHVGASSLTLHPTLFLLDHPLHLFRKLACAHQGTPPSPSPACRSACSISYTTSRRASTQRRKKWRWAARSRMARQARQAQQAQLALQARRVQRVHQTAAAAAAAAVAAAALAAKPLRREPPLTSKGTWQTLAAGGQTAAACTGQLVHFEGYLPFAVQERWAAAAALCNG